MAELNLEGLDLRAGAITQVIGQSGSGLSRLAEQLRGKHPGAAVVIQDALAHITFLRRTVAEEVAFGLEQRGTDCAEMRCRVHVVLTALRLDHLAKRDPTKLSGGQSKRLAVAAVMVLEPEVLILDDSFAGLDAGSAEALVRALTGYSGAVVVLGNRAQDLPGEVFTLIDGSLIPGLPGPAKVALPEPVRGAFGEVIELGEVVGDRGGRRARWWRFGGEKVPEFTVGPVDLSLRRGEVLWLQGANGSGKTTLLRAIAGLDGAPAPQPGVSLMLQRPEDQVVNPTVGEFVGDADAVEKLGLDAEEHPLDLPAAKLRLAQAAFVFAQGRAVVLLDEPDVGLDDSARAEFHAMLANALRAGRAVVMTCHDPGFMGEVGEYGVVEMRVLAE